MADGNFALLGVGPGSSGVAPSANYLSIPTAGYHVSTPDTVALRPGSNTIDLRGKFAMSTWTPAGNSFLISKFGSEYAMYIDSAGKLNGVWTNPATVGQFCVSSVATGVSANATKWVRVLMNPGVGGGTCDFFTSDDGSTWNALGTQVTGKTTTGVVVPGTPASLRTGETDAGGGQWAAATAKIFRVQVLINSVLISDMDFSLQTLGATGTTFTATTGETWTIANSAIIANT